MILDMISMKKFKEFIAHWLFLVGFMSFSLLFGGLLYFDTYISKFCRNTFLNELTPLQLLYFSINDNTLKTIQYIVFFLIAIFVIQTTPKPHFTPILGNKYIKKIRLYFYKKTGWNAALFFSPDTFLIFIFKILTAFSMIAIWLVWIVSFSYFGATDAEILKKMPAKTLIQYSKNNNKTVVNVTGNIVYETKVGVIFYTHKINSTQLKHLVTIFIPYSRIETIYNQPPP